MPSTKINTPAELRSACCLNLCYTDEQLAAHLPLTLTTLLAVPLADAIYCLAGLLSKEQRIEWANACARRAKEYANAAAARAATANGASASAADWAAAANRAAAAADRAAAATADTARAAAWAEQHIAIRHAALLLGLPE